MDFLDNKYDSLRGYIERQINLGKNYEDLKKMSEKLKGILPDEENLKNMLSVIGLPEDLLTVSEWYEYVDWVQSEEEPKQEIFMGKESFNDSGLSDNPYSTWQIYKNKLTFGDEAIRDIEKTSLGIVKRLTKDGSGINGSVKSLVIGDVQSGKTANMAGVIANAADNGWNLFIILSGTIENLRMQTKDRLVSDLTVEGTMISNFKTIEKPSNQQNIPEIDLDYIDLGSRSKTKVLNVSLKNKTRLEGLRDWLLSNEAKTKQMRIVLIDDEADQASINTNKIDDPETDATTINRLITEIVNCDKFGAMNYIAYTATPYALVLNECKPESLYPRDFIVALNPSSDYMGPKQFFGLQQPQTIESLSVIRDVPKYEADELLEYLGDNSKGYPHKHSLKKAVYWFLISVAAMRANNYNKPISMLVHTGMKIVSHGQLEGMINELLDDFYKNYSTRIQEVEKMYYEETRSFDLRDFKAAMPNYTQQIQDYPEWEKVKDGLDYLHSLNPEEYKTVITLDDNDKPKYTKGIHVVVDNSQKRPDDSIRLIYPKEKSGLEAKAFIVIGGNTLSRGLTIKGLVSTFFIRPTKTGDTLLQMGRWFGYRQGYELYPRIWMDSQTRIKFEEMAQVNEELKQEIRTYASRGLTPENYAPRVKNSSNYQILRITTSNKMQNANEADWDFRGFEAQTLFFYKDISILKKNIEATEALFEDIGTRPEKINRSHLLFKNVKSKMIIDFLKKYKVTDEQNKLNPKRLQNLIKWVEENASEKIADWNVLIASKGDIPLYEESDAKLWNVNGYDPSSITRSQIKETPYTDIAYIKSLRTEGDLLIDVVDERNPLSEDEKKANSLEDVLKIREIHHYGSVPLLVLYRIDKNSKASVVSKEKNQHRKDMDTEEDLIGFDILIPGFTGKKNKAETLQQNLGTTH